MSLIIENLNSRREFVKKSSLALSMFFLPIPLMNFSKYDTMKNDKIFDVIIIGGSYSGLSAAMTLGRALKSVLIIDNAKPCNIQTPHSHNFLTQDGSTPKEISTLARNQVEKYKSVKFFDGNAVEGVKNPDSFSIKLESGEEFTAKKIVFATGIRDVFPKIKGFSDCWGISVLHCPYCHGYEVKNLNTGILGNGESGFELTKLISNWTNDLTLFTNGISLLNQEQTNQLNSHSIKIEEKEIELIEHVNGQISSILFKDGTKTNIEVFYAPRPFVQHCLIPEQLGCKITEQGYIEVNHLQKTTIEGVYACGDNCTKMRTVANAVSMGTTTGIMLNKEMVFENF